MSTAERHAEAGFTLVETLVALAVFSLAALALLRLQGVTASTTLQLDTRLLAGIVAQNQAVEALLMPPQPGQGEEWAGGRRWRWTRAVTPAADPRLLRIDVAVTDSDGRPAAAANVLRRRP